MKIRKNIFLGILIFTLLAVMNGCIFTKNIETQEDLTGQNFQTYFDNRTKFPDEDPGYINRIFTVRNLIDPCPPEPEGPCGFDLYIVSDDNWEDHGKELQTFYLEDQSATGRIFYGPFEDNLERIVEEAGEMNE